MFTKAKVLVASLALLGGLSVMSTVSFAKTKIPQEYSLAYPKLVVGSYPPVDPPRTGTPAGGTLDPSDPCHSDTIHLAALAPPDNSFSDYPDLEKYPLLTISERPTFLFYVPYRQDQVRHGEFSIHEWPNEEASRPYSANVTFPQTPGIVSVSVPSNSGYRLVDGKDYRWRLKLYCGPGNTASDYVIVRGTMRKIVKEAEAEALVSEFAPEIWYDSVARLAAQLQSSNSSSLASQWSSLMQLVEFGKADSSDFTPDLIQGAATVR
ncbi:DUF928 domain-containing protein [Leptolyngbya cf. ectocarpi LEGE 11479]|uniref:DUF928 domain-containing protein n=1 Tax=Leptolyngbya cf. ectocarpi LEGE 11479 TaxID=1828722 RepID=A0A928ZWB1_LEPEC|nr:DUF928 domain-containing protein [Leptolyngbya ectocarpi]MBE9068651.1 DUF928 domain-containing protein [Leptolyngbya cf. ectocarpi LEGE 11479]